MQATDGNGRPGSRPTAYGESQPLGEFITTVLRYLPFVLVAAALTAVLAFVVTTPEPPQPTATSQVGLTQRVVWPFYDTARQRAVTTIEDPSFVADLTERVAQGPLTVEVDAPESQAFVYINVTGETPQAAAAAADEAADLLLERDTARLAQAAEAELERATSLLEASQQRESTLSARLAELLPAEAEAGARVGNVPGSAEARQALLTAEVERTSVSQRLNEELRTQVSMEIAVQEARAEVAATVSELEILSRADAPEIGVERSYIPVVAAAIAAMIAGLAAAIMWDRTRGPLASRWHAEQVAGVPVLADMGSSRFRERAAGLFLSGLVDGAKAHGNVVAFTGLRGTKTDRWMAMIVQYFQLAGIKVLVVVSANSEQIVFGDGRVADWTEVAGSVERARSLQGVSTLVLPSTVMLLDTALMRPVIRDIAQSYHLVLIAGGNVDDPDSDLAVALADSTVLIARKRYNRVDQLRRAARAVGYREEALLGVVLGSNRLPLPQLATASNTNGASFAIQEPLTESREAQWTS